MLDNRLSTRWALFPLAAVLAIAVGIVVWRFTWGTAAITHLDLVTDMRDDRRLAGIAHNVFIGRVQEEDVHVVISGGYGRIEIAGSENLDAHEVLTSWAAAELKARFVAAVDNQIPYRPGD